MKSHLVRYKRHSVLFNGTHIERRRSLLVLSLIMSSLGLTCHVLLNPTPALADYTIKVNYYHNGATSGTVNHNDTQEALTLTNPLKRYSSGTLQAVPQSFKSGKTYKNGLCDYSTGGTWKLAKTGYHATGYWLVGSASSPSKKIHETTGITSTAANAVANFFGRSQADATINVYAEWAINTYSVKYNGNGATSGSMSNSSHTYNTAKALSANAFKRAYTVTYNYNGSGANNTTATATYSFKNWNTVSNGSGTNYNNQQSVKNLSLTNGATVNLYAQWNSATVTLPTPTRTGYTFDGWYKEANCTNKVGAGGASYTPTANITLYAKWTANTHSITYAGMEGAQISSAPTTATYNSALTVSNPVKAGYSFSGWNITGMDSTSHVYGSSTTNATSLSGRKETSYKNLRATSGTVTFTAIWVALTYTVKYDPNGGEGDSFSQTITEDVDFTLSQSRFKNSGYVFTGWNTKEDGSGIMYSAGQKARNIVGEKLTNAEQLGQGWSGTSYPGTSAPVAAPSQYGSYGSFNVRDHITSNLDMTVGTVYKIAGWGIASTSAQSPSHVGFYKVVNGARNWPGGTYLPASTRTWTYNTYFYTVESGTTSFQPWVQVAGWSTTDTTNYTGNNIYGGWCWTGLSVRDMSIKETTLYAQWEPVYPDSGKAYAVLTDGNDPRGPGHLVFFRSFAELSAGPGQTVKSINDSEYSGTIYTNVETLNLNSASAPWHADKNDIIDSYVEEATTIRPSNMAWWFADLPNLTNVLLDSFETGTNTSYESLFQDCPQLAIMRIPSESMPRVSSVKNMFKGCSGLKLAAISGSSNSSSITMASGMFDGCSALVSATIGGLGTSGVSDMSNMFRGCSAMVTLKLECDTGNVTDMSEMFKGCLSLEELDISAFDMSAVSGTREMFDGDENLYSLTIGESFAEASPIQLPGNHDSQHYVPDAWTNGVDVLEDGLFDVNGNNPYIGEEMAGTWVWQDKDGLTEYPIRYSLNGGTNPDGQPVVYRTIDGAVLSAPSKEGYEFIGWSADTADAPILSEGVIVPGANGTKRFVAHWQETQAFVNINLIYAGAAFRKLAQADGTGLPGASFTIFKANDVVSNIEQTQPGQVHDFNTALVDSGWAVSTGSGRYNEDQLNENGWQTYTSLESANGGWGTTNSDTLGPGIYAVVETMAPKEYSLPEQPVFYTFEVSKEIVNGTILTSGYQQGVLSNEQPMDFSNDLPDDFDGSQHGGLSIRKTAADGTPLAGAHFAVYDYNSFSAAVAASGGILNQAGGRLSNEILSAVCSQDGCSPATPEIVTGDDGVASTSLQALDAGVSYAVFETQGPDGYKLGGENYSWFLFTIAGGAIETQGKGNGTSDLEEAVMIDAPLSNRVSLSAEKILSDYSRDFPQGKFEFELIDESGNAVALHGEDGQAVYKTSNQFDSDVDPDDELTEITDTMTISLDDPEWVDEDGFRSIEKTMLRSARTYKSMSIRVISGDEEEASPSDVLASVNAADDTITVVDRRYEESGQQTYSIDIDVTYIYNPWPSTIIFELDEEFTADVLGTTRNYTMREIKGSDTSYSYDERELPVTVTFVASEDGQSIVAECSFPNGKTFVNEYLDIFFLPGTGTIPFIIGAAALLIGIIVIIVARGRILHAKRSGNASISNGNIVRGSRHDKR